MFTLQCGYCGHEWIAPRTAETHCPNCHSIEPFKHVFNQPKVEVSAAQFAAYNQKAECYSRSELDPTYVLHNPIYDATPEERLADVIRAAEQALSILQHPELMPLRTNSAESFKHGEFAIGNWVIRPRFR